MRTSTFTKYVLSAWLLAVMVLLFPARAGAQEAASEPLPLDLMQHPLPKGAVLQGEHRSDFVSYVLHGQLHVLSVRDANGDHPVVKHRVTTKSSPYSPNYTTEVTDTETTYVGKTLLHPAHPHLTKVTYHRSGGTITNHTVVPAAVIPFHVEEGMALGHHQFGAYGGYNIQPSSKVVTPHHDRAVVTANMLQGMRRRPTPQPANFGRR
jgi:hypothetical protein